MEPHLEPMPASERTASGSHIRVACVCGATLVVSLSRSGHSVRCPQCSNAVLVDPARAVGRRLGGAASNEDSAYIRYYCVCGKALKNERALIGRWVKCPACETVMNVPPYSTRGEGGDRQIEVICFCGLRMRFADWHIGQEFQCPECKRVARIPDMLPSGVCDLRTSGGDAAEPDAE